ncbi:hypothetical protein BJV78DRAFT_1158298 [Lactifluus subvellereus]|nr:hypothetical protein BJV78DRAFT_1158298 [Lactifluus subvellereus]
MVLYGANRHKGRGWNWAGYELQLKVAKCCGGAWWTACGNAQATRTVREFVTQEILMPPIQKDTLKLNCFWAKHHTVDFMAADASTVNLATSCGMDVQVWKGDKCYDWKGHRILGVPKKSADNCTTEIVLTGLHWCGSSSASDMRLITTYCHHSIQSARLWDIKKMAVIQSINMPYPIYPSPSVADMICTA